MESIVAEREWWDFYQSASQASKYLIWSFEIDENFKFGEKP